MFRHDGVTPLSGTSYTAELLAGPTPFSVKIVATTNFLSGAQAGYFDGGVQSIPDVAAGSNALFEIRLRTTSSGSFAAAQAANFLDSWAQSQMFQVKLGGQGSPAILTPLPALWLNNVLSVPAANLYVNFNRVDNTAVVSWESSLGIYLEVSTNLVQWTNFVGSAPHAFPLIQGPVFFRAKKP